VKLTCTVPPPPPHLPKRSCTRVRLPACSSPNLPQALCMSNLASSLEDGRAQGIYHIITIVTIVQYGFAAHLRSLKHDANLAVFNLLTMCVIWSDKGQLVNHWVVRPWVPV